MNVAAAAKLLTEITAMGFSLSQKIGSALANRRETIEVGDIGARFKDVNDRIQAARGPQDSPPAAG